MSRFISRSLCVRKAIECLPLFSVTPSCSRGFLTSSPGGGGGQDSAGHSFNTRLENVFVIGEGNKPWISLPKALKKKSMLPNQGSCVEQGTPKMCLKCPPVKRVPKDGYGWFPSWLPSNSTAMHMLPYKYDLFLPGKGGGLFDMAPVLHHSPFYREQP